MSAVRAEFGETLPAMLRRRHGISPVVPVAVAAVLLLALGALALTAGSKTAGKDKLVHAGTPVFNVLVTPGKVRRVAPRSGELMRLEAAGGGYRASVTYRTFRLPTFTGNVSGVLPIYATRDVAPPELVDEAKARVNDAPGYQVGLKVAGVTLRRVYVVAQDTGTRDGVLIEFRQTGKGPAGVVTAAKKAFRSFRFGTERG